MQNSLAFQVIIGGHSSKLEVKLILSQDKSVWPHNFMVIGDTYGVHMYVAIFYLLAARAQKS